MFSLSVALRNALSVEVHRPFGARSHWEYPRSVSLGNLVAAGESGQASLNARGVLPVHRRKDRWNAAGSEVLQKERDVVDAQAAILKQAPREVTSHLVENMAE